MNRKTMKLFYFFFLVSAFLQPCLAYSSSDSFAEEFYQESGKRILTQETMQCSYPYPFQPDPLVCCISKTWKGFRVNEGTTPTSFPSVAALANGGFTVVWNNEGKAQGQTYDSRGLATGAEFQFPTETSANVYCNDANTYGNIGLTGLKNGGFVVTCIARYTLSVSPWASLNITGQVYDDIGVSRGAAFVGDGIGIDHPSDMSGANVAPLTNGGFVVAWGQYQVGYPDCYPDYCLNTYGQTYDHIGAPTSTAFQTGRIKVSGQSGKLYSTVASLSKGGFVSIWKVSFPQYPYPTPCGEGYGYCFRGQTFSDTGSPTGAAFYSNLGYGSDSGPISASLSNGGFVLASKNRVQIYNDIGVPLGAAFTVGPNYATTALAGLDGLFLVSWLYGANSGTAIYGQLYNNTGGPVGDAFPVADPNSVVFGIGVNSVWSLAGLNNERFVTVWDSPSNPDCTLRGNIYAKVFKTRLREVGTSL